MQTVAIVGGSKGIGLAILQEQLSLGNLVYNLSRSKPEINHTNLTHFECDALLDKFPEIECVDTLIYCPGSINLKPITMLSIEDFKSDFDINVVGAIQFIKKYLPVLKKSENGSILLFSTVAVKMGMQYHASVAASKAAVEGLTKSLAAELAPKIRVNAIAPTVTNTNLAAKLLRNDEMKKRISERHPLQRYLETPEVASLASYLISAHAKSISGQIIQLDNGLTTLKL